MIMGELICISSEFQVEIQDVNYLLISIANMESLPTLPNSSPPLCYFWSMNKQAERMSVQAIAITSMNAQTSKSSTNSTEPSTRYANKSPSKPNRKKQAITPYRSKSYS